MSHIIGFFVGVVASLVGAIMFRFLVERYSYHISFRRVFKAVMVLRKTIQAEGFVPDYLVGVDRNGCIIASILSGYMGLRTIIAASTENIRCPDGSREIQLSPAHMPRDGVLSGKKILIVSCFVDTGSALGLVYNYYHSLRNGPSEIRTAALYTTMSPSLGSR